GHFFCGCACSRIFAFVLLTKISLPPNVTDEPRAAAHKRLSSSENAVQSGLGPWKIAAPISALALATGSALPGFAERGCASPTFFQELRVAASARQLAATSFAAALALGRLNSCCSQKNLSSAERLRSATRLLVLEVHRG